MHDTKQAGLYKYSNLVLGCHLSFNFWSCILGQGPDTKSRNKNSILETN